MKQILGLLTVVIAFIGYAPYVRDTIIGKTKPHVFSWFLWSLVWFVTFGLQWSKGAEAGSYANFAIGLICFVVFILSFKNGIKNIKTVDVISLILAILAIILWLGINQPVWSIILLIITDIFSSLPTYIKSWSKPQEETLLTWIFNAIRQTIVLLSISKLNFVTVAFPLYVLINNTLFFTLLIVRRKRVLR
jgi:hypothetical protein